MSDQPHLPADLHTYRYDPRVHPLPVAPKAAVGDTIDSPCGWSSVVSIEMGNDAMQSPEDVAHALVEIAADLRAGGFARHAQNVRDANGNRVGTYKLYVRED